MTASNGWGPEALSSEAEHGGVGSIESLMLTSSHEAWLYIGLVSSIQALSLKQGVLRGWLRSNNRPRREVGPGLMKDIKGLHGSLRYCEKA